MSVTLDLDDLESFDGFDSGMRTPETPGSPIAPMYSPVGMMIGQISPTRTVLSGGEGSYGRHQAHSIHGVHMHTHENTKVPLLNHAVDRTNSSRPSYPPVSHETQRGLSMAELFLRKESNNRQSLNRNYESHALLDDVGIGAMARRSSNDGMVTSDRVVASTALIDDETQMEIDALSAAIDPTPWSEMEQQVHSAQESGNSTALHPHHYSYYPYGRHHQLPIPYRPPPSPPTEMPLACVEPLQSHESTPLETRTLQDALVTAAQLASVGATVDVAGATKPIASPAVPRPAPPLESMHFTSSSTNAQRNPKTYIQAPGTVHIAIVPPVLPAAQQYQLKRATYSPPEHATAHTTSRASVLAAANKKTQYGFGGNHVVPSVPAPPPSASTRGHDKGIQKTVLPPPSSEASTGYSGVAYERKKQRAKDARIKLNEAIERLSIAMNLSGTQSKQRIHLLNARIRQTEQRTKSLHIADECIKLAEQAKKWDRPSFLSSAASIVQALNSQCESLSRELVCLQERLDATTGSSGGVPGTIPPPPMMVTVEQKHKRPESPSPNESPAKRIKTEDCVASSNSPVRAIEPSDLDEILLVQIAKLLDHVSLSQCVSVSRKWRSTQAFENADVWFQLAVKRFGFYNVRQWAEKLEDTENELLDLSKKALFRAMSSANVMPHIQHPNGVTLLGDAKIPGRVSAWVFMVDRSNGETLRSVKRDPSRDCAVGVGLYHSRPVVELRIVIQNTGMVKGPVVIKEQKFTVDISTRRSGGELDEIQWDDRFSKIVKTLDGLQYNTRVKSPTNGSSVDGQGELCRLALFEAVEITIHVDARGCSTSSKFRQKSNFTKILVSLEGTTVPMVIPFAR